MAKLLTLKHARFKKELDAHFGEDQDITSLDLFNTFVTALEKDTNMLSGDPLKALVFNQFKVYGDFDKTMNEVAQKLSEINESTGNAIKAIDEKDESGLKDAYSKLKDYQQRINELEEDVYSDDIADAYNRKYLTTQELDVDGNFKGYGHLMHLSIMNLEAINKEHGHESGDVVLRFVSKSLQKKLRPLGMSLIRYQSSKFVCLAKTTLAKKSQDIFEETVSTILTKKFKTQEEKTLSIKMQFGHKVYSKGEKFLEVCENLE